MYDTLELREVKRIRRFRIPFFPFFLTNWHKTRKSGLFCVFDQPEKDLVCAWRHAANPLSGNILRYVSLWVAFLHCDMHVTPGPPAARLTT